MQRRETGASQGCLRARGKASVTEYSGQAENGGKGDRGQIMAGLTCMASGFSFIL